MIPKIYQICQDATSLLIRKAKAKKDKQSGFKGSSADSDSPSITDAKALNAIKMKKKSPSKSSNTWGNKVGGEIQTDEEDSQKEETLDMHMEILSQFLSEHLPAVEGDITIQIGTTYQRYGDKHPFLKHIITLDTCQSIDRFKLIEHEHKDITFPDRELLNGIKKIYKVIIDDAKNYENDKKRKRAKERGSRAK